MAMTNDEKLTFAVSKFKEKLLSIETWTEFKNLVSSIKKTKVKTFLKSALQQEADRRKQFATDETETATNLKALKDEINSI
ncbi:hypothetical protein KA005_09695 [bacterium]|nr:hypothetical protein [bacterium]